MRRILTGLCLMLWLLAGPVTAQVPEGFAEDFEGRFYPLAGNEQVTGALPRGAFQEVSGWSPITVSYQQMTSGAHQGRSYLRINRDEKGTHQYMAPQVRMTGEHYLRVRFAVRSPDESAMTVVLQNSKDPVTGTGYATRWMRSISPDKQWTVHDYLIPPLPEPDVLRIKFAVAPGGTIDLDMIEASYLNRQAAERLLRQQSGLRPDGRWPDGQAEKQPDYPWPPQYKLGEKDELTAADLRGPDGIVYPDFSRAGIPDGIPQVRPILHVGNFGARPNDDRDDSEAIQRAIEAAAQRGGGAVVLAPGTYQLDHHLRIVHDNVVLRGAGRERTRLVFRWQPPVKQVVIATPRANATIPENQPFWAHVDPENLKEVRFLVDGEQVYRQGAAQTRPDMYGYYFHSHTAPFRGKKQARITVEAEYADGRVLKAEHPVRIDARLNLPNGQRRMTYTDAIIELVGDEWTHRGRRPRIAKDLRRGEDLLVLAEPAPFEKGDIVIIHTPPNERFLKQLKSAYPHVSRRMMVEIVEKLDERRYRLAQPVREDFLASEGTTVETRVPIRGSGVEGMTIAQTHRSWTEGIVLRSAMHCWVRDVRIEKAGRSPLVIGGSKNCEVRDVELIDAWFKGGGATAYLQIGGSYDCLVANVKTEGLRHAPNFSATSSGNVVRDSTFISSDLQYHNIRALENLVENCTIDATQGTGSYGYGVYAQRPEVNIHGPGAGPRNVVWNCDITSPLPGVYLGGSNENTIIAYNRFHVRSGSGVVVRRQAFDAIIRGNHFILDQPSEPLVRIETDDVPGLELIDNQIAGSYGPLFIGPITPARWQNNRFLPTARTLPRPTPPIPSLHDWQKSQQPRPR